MLEAGSFSEVREIDFRSNKVDDQMKLICVRNFENLEKIYVTDNPFVKIYFSGLKNQGQELNPDGFEGDLHKKPSLGYEFLKTEVFERTGGEVIVENVEYQMREREKKKRGARVVVFGDLVVVKEEQFNDARFNAGSRELKNDEIGLDFAQKQRELNLKQSAKDYSEQINARVK